MGDLEVLLEVQPHDTHIDQLEHRRRALPERGELATVEADVAAVEKLLADLDVNLAAARAVQARHEGDLASTEARIAEVDKRLYGGTVSASRDLQAMSDEVDSLKRRSSLLEDEVLAAMEAVEPLQRERDELDARRAALDERAGALRAAIAEAEVAIEAELEAERAQRAAVVGPVPADLLATYERLRTKLGGVGAARLEHGTCTGCHLSLPSGELERIRREPPDAVVLCDQCGRILVR